MAAASQPFGSGARLLYGSAAGSMLPGSHLLSKYASLGHDVDCNLTNCCFLQIPGPRDKREEAEQVQKKFAASEGDLITLLNVWRTYR